MRAKEFLKEYMNYTPIKIDPIIPTDPLNDARERIEYLLKKGEARDYDHALKIVSNETACELEMDPVEVKSRIKAIM